MRFSIKSKTGRTDGATPAGRAALNSRIVRALGLHIGPLLLAIAIAGVYLLLDLRGGDLAAHLFRAELLKRDGFFVWNYNWYGGHYTVSYGLMFPGLAATIGVRLAGTLTYIAGTLLFSMLAHRVWEHRGASAAAYVFALSFSASLLIGQLPFALGVAFGLAALMVAANNRVFWAGFLALNCALTSPLAALFIAFVAGTVWLSGRSWAMFAVGCGTLVPAMTLSFFFPEGGSQPFHIASYAGAMFLTGLFWFVIKDELEDRARQMIGTGVALYAVFLTINEIVPSPIGGNAIRLGMLAFAPLIAASLWPRSGKFALALIVPFFAWQAGPAVWAVITQDRSTHPKFYEPVNAWLDRQDSTRQQSVEVVFTRNHFEAAYVAVQRPIARGWERQLDTKYNSIFYDGELTSASYQRWLNETGVRWVALPNAALDYSARREAEIVKSDPPYLQLRGTLKDWRIYEVSSPRPVTAETLAINSADPGRIEVQPERYGTTVTSVRWQRFWRPSAGCISRSPDGFLTIELPRPPGVLTTTKPTTVELAPNYSFGRLIGLGRSCALGADPDQGATGPGGTVPPQPSVAEQRATPVEASSPGRDTGRKAAA